MRIDIKNNQELQGYINKIDKHINSNNKLEWTRYVTLGAKTVRLLGYSNDFLSHVEKQLTYILKDSAETFDATIILWNEKGSFSLSNDLLSEQPLHRKRVEKLITKSDILSAEVFDRSISNNYPLIKVNPFGGLVSVFDKANEVYYYGVEDLSPEEFIKEGHLFVQFFNKIVQDSSTALVHGALVGLEGDGVLFCARGQRGKSTLSVLSMMDGFDYVSDDYLVLEKDGCDLYTHPIYSIITLSPRMYNELYDRLEGSRFLSNNGRKDKYVVNISNYHDRFKSKYPVKFCMFPEIVNDNEPSIIPCPKGRAIAQLVQSTVCQLQDSNNHTVIKKLIEMVSNYEFYQINLCQDIQKNTDCLRDFMKNYENREKKLFIEDEIYVDITFNLAHILNSNTGTVYSMNEFATNIYENLVAGVRKDDILGGLTTIKGMPMNIEDKVNILVSSLVDKGIVKELDFGNEPANINYDIIKKCSYKLEFVEFTENQVKKLV